MSNEMMMQKIAKSIQKIREFFECPQFWVVLDHPSPPIRFLRNDLWPILQQHI